MDQRGTAWAKNKHSSDVHSNRVAAFRRKQSVSETVYCQLSCIFPSWCVKSVCVCGFSICTYDVESKGNEAMVSAQDAERLLPLHQCEEVICHRLPVEKVIYAKEEVPVQIRDESD